MDVGGKGTQQSMPMVSHDFGRRGKRKEAVPFKAQVHDSGFAVLQAWAEWLTRASFIEIFLHFWVLSRRWHHREVFLSVLYGAERAGLRDRYSFPLI